MDSARADVLAARSRLASGGWIPRQAEFFRHLPPPAAEVWLGDTTGAADCEASPLAGAGWTLHPVGHAPQGRVDARWLDAADPAQRAELFAGVPPPGEGDAAPFAWAHRALCRQGLRLRIGAPDGSDAREAPTVWLQLRRQPRAVVEAPLLVIEVAAGLRCVLIETHEREASACGHAIVQNLQVHITLAEGATLAHLRVAAPGAQDRIAHHVHGRLGRGADYRQALVASDCAYHLQRTELDLHAPQASARTAGALFAAGAALEQQVQTSHAGAHTHSAVEALVLASGTARAVVNAYTRIAPGSDDASVRQRLAGIPTGGQPKLVLRPQLEIHHDAVQAAHGATWGSLPEEALFYAQQRGLDERTARALIVEGMVSALLDRCFDDPGLLQMLDVEPLLARSVARHLAATEEAIHG
ncbi:MAG TPA: SufD family Fe-S cluster assembly protein [Albitalea sp.]|nr:SufD family Fe-S cluster assembly protein [Albitalea sp.]